MARAIELRRLLVVIAAAAALLGAAGVTQEAMFRQPSTLKYALTVAGPLFLAALLAVRQPLALVTALLLLAAPFAGLQMTAPGFKIPLLGPILILGVFVAALSRPPARRRSTLSVAALALIVTFVIPVVDSPTRPDVLAVLASLLLAAYLAARVSTEPSGLIALMWAFVLSGAIQATLAIWEHATGQRVNFYGLAGTQVFGSGYSFGYNGTSRPLGAFYDPISLGNALAIAVPLGAGLVIHYGRLRRRLLMGAAAAAAAVIVVGLELSLSRMSWIGAALGLVATALLLPSAPRALVVPALVLAVAIPTAFGVFSGASTGVQRLSSIVSPLNAPGTSQGDRVRVDVWRHAVSTAAEHPITGVGFGRFQRILAAEYAPAGTQGHAQSTYLQVAVEGGIMALVGLLAVLYALGVDISKALARDRLTGATLAGACIAMLITWTTDVTVRYSGVAVLMGALFGMAAGRARWASSRVAGPT